MVRQDLGAFVGSLAASATSVYRNSPEFRARVLNCPPFLRTSIVERRGWSCRLETPLLEIIDHRRFVGSGDNHAEEDDAPFEHGFARKCHLSAGLISNSRFRQNAPRFRFGIIRMESRKNPASERPLPCRRIFRCLVSEQRQHTVFSGELQADRPVKGCPVSHPLLSQLPRGGR